MITNIMEKTIDKKENKIRFFNESTNKNTPPYKEFFFILNFEP